MRDVDTVLTTLYVTVDDFCQSRVPKRKPGPEASLFACEVIPLRLSRIVGLSCKSGRRVMRERAKRLPWN
jgi:hypothetical protein